MPRPELSTELWLDIFDLVARDVHLRRTGSFLSVLLTCRRWNRMGAGLMYRHIRITRERTCILLMQVLSQSPHDPGRLTHTLFFALDLRGSITTKVYWPSVLLPRMPNLKSLIFLYPALLSSRDLASILPVCNPYIRMLAAEVGDTGMPAWILGSISRFQYLRQLVLDLDDRQPPPHSTQFVALVLPHLQSLKITIRPRWFAWPWLSLARSRFVSLEDFNCSTDAHGGAHYSGLHQLEDFFQNHSATLLTVTLSDYYNVGMPMGIFRPLRKLRFLCLYGSSPPDDSILPLPDTLERLQIPFYERQELLRSLARRPPLSLKVIQSPDRFDDWAGPVDQQERDELDKLHERVIELRQKRLSVVDYTGRAYPAEFFQRPVMRPDWAQTL